LPLLEVHVLWLKAFHIVFVVTWFAGLFYLPRLFVYHALAEDAPAHARFVVMERKLFAIMTIGAALAAAFGFALLVVNPALLDARWLRAKLVLVAGLVAYHLYCRRLMTELREGHARGDRWYRWYNEVPALALLAIVVLAVVKPAL
jgi:protoporphyrinogen IX oxidase